MRVCANTYVKGMLTNNDQDPASERRVALMQTPTSSSRRPSHLLSQAQLTKWMLFTATPRQTTSRKESRVARNGSH